ncbi:MAG TPA: acetylglutamate kinase [Parasegetibacter sp.]
MKPTLNIIKIGGNVIDDPEFLQSFINRFSDLSERRILIHGGGKLATRIGDQMGIVSKYIDGRRITDEPTRDLVTMVYGGLINKQIVAGLTALDTAAIGVTGADANLIPASKRPVKSIDYGWVGDVDPDKIPVDKWTKFIENKMIPVVAPLTHDGQGNMLNTNADTIASSVAVALSEKYAVRLIYCFEKKGVLENIDDENSVIPLLDRALYNKLKSENKLFAGILPKIDNAFAAIESGVAEVIIGHAGDLDSHFTDKTTGTLIR